MVGRGQLLRVGISSSAIARGVRSGWLLVEHRGVYRVGHVAPSREATYLAAVMACGLGAVLFSLPAAHLHVLLRGVPPAPEVMTGTERRIRGVATKRSRSLHRRDTTRVHGIPVTTVARTLIDLAGVLSLDALALACHEAGVKHALTPRELAAALERKPNARGAGNLREVMSGEVKVTLSALEKEFLSLLAAEGLPAPATNKPAGGRRVDCRWPENRLTVELDSYRFHSSRHAWERDRRREREAYARGDQFRRYTYGDVFERPGQMLSELRPLLDGRPA